MLGFARNFLASEVDFDLLEDVARALPEGTLLLIGPAAPKTASALERLAQLPSVRWLGQKPYAVPRYVAAFDVELIPYVSNAYTRSCFPLKLYGYLAAGKPVVASGLPELAGTEPDVVLVDGATTFIQAVQRAVGRNGEAERLRRRSSHPATAGRPRQDGSSSSCTESSRCMGLQPDGRCAFSLPAAPGIPTGTE